MPRFKLIMVTMTERRNQFFPASLPRLHHPQLSNAYRSRNLLDGSFSANQLCSSSPQHEGVLTDFRVRGPPGFSSGSRCTVIRSEPDTNPIKTPHSSLPPCRGPVHLYLHFLAAAQDWESAGLPVASCKCSKSVGSASGSHHPPG